jgi:hypothetical protein
LTEGLGGAADFWVGTCKGGDEFWDCCGCANLTKGLDDGLADEGGFGGECGEEGGAKFGVVDFLDRGGGFGADVGIRVVGRASTEENRNMVDWETKLG